MTENNDVFIPLTGKQKISGTSYSLQLGLINDKYASRLLKGKGVIDSYIYEDVEGVVPNGNRIVSWVLKNVAILNINPHQIMKTTQFLLRQARENTEKKQILIPAKIVKEVKLKKVSDSELKRPQAQDWVKNSLDLKKVCSSMNKLKTQIDHIDTDNFPDEILKKLEILQRNLRETSNCMCGTYKDKVELKITPLNLNPLIVQSLQDKGYNISKIVRNLLEELDNK
ncbi:hypothetical protein ES706_04110 [subsurface metagenome]